MNIGHDVTMDVPHHVLDTDKMVTDFSGSRPIAFRDRLTVRPLAYVQRLDWSGQCQDWTNSPLVTSPTYTGPYDHFSTHEQNIPMTRQPQNGASARYVFDNINTVLTCMKI